MSPFVRKSLAALTVATVVAAPAAAFASHYRSVYSTTSQSAGTITWNLINATESGNSDYFDSTVDVKLLSSSADAVNSGTDTGSDFSEQSLTEDLSYSLYASTEQVYTFNASALADGIYEAYTENSARLDGVQNTGAEDSVSAWIRFTVASGVVNLPPVFNAPSLYELIAPNSTVTADFRATDPEGGAVTYTLLTDTASPTYASTAIPCSDFTGGVITIGPAECTGGDVFADIFDADNAAYNGVIPSWTAKVEAKDAAGNVATSDVLFRLLSVPDPYIDTDRWVGANDYELDIYAADTVSDFISVECVNDNDPTDVVTAEGETSPLTVRNLRVGDYYTCTPYAENAAGGADGSTYGIGPVEGIMLELDLEVGVQFSGASSNIVGGGLKANSDYTLTMYSDPIEIYAGVSDENGNFDELVTIPAEACIPGIHHLILSGVDPSDNPVQDEQWIEIGNDCEVLQFSNDEITESLAATGFDVTTGLLVATVLGASGIAIVASRRRERRN